MEPHFIHLRLHTEYSLSDGLIQISPLIEKAAACGMPAVAITDHGNLYAAVKFYQAALKAGIKPIIGVDVRILNEENPKASWRLTLLCQSQIGYQNLLKLVTKSHLEGKREGIPLIHPTWLSSHTEGLIALSGGQEGDIGEALL